MRPRRACFLSLALFQNGSVALIAAVACLLLVTASCAFAQDEPPETLWTALQPGGYTMLMRHAYAPGMGDPDNFSLDDCSTQRLLSAEGREQARQLGEAFRSRGVPVSHVYSSELCRATETAELLDMGNVEPLPLINSLVHTPETADSQTRQLAAFVSTPPQNGNVLLVTHQGNIQALTGRALNEGEIIVLEPLENDFDVLGVIRPIP